MIRSLQTEGTLFPVQRYRYPVHPKYALSIIDVFFFIWLYIQQFRKNVLEVYYCQKTQFISAQKIIAHLDISVITVKVHGLTSISVSRFEGQCLIDFFPRITGRAHRTTSNPYDLVLIRPCTVTTSFTLKKSYFVQGLSGIFPRYDSYRTSHDDPWIQFENSCFSDDKCNRLVFEFL